LGQASRGDAGYQSCKCEGPERERTDRKPMSYLKLVISRRARGSVAALLPLLAVLRACARNPVRGQRELSLTSESQEIEMGEQAPKDVESSIVLVDDADLQAYVRNIGTRLAAKSERPRLPWHFSVVDDPTPNAFALPGGQIFVTRGLLGLMDS